MPKNDTKRNDFYTSEEKLRWWKDQLSKNTRRFEFIVSRIETLTAEIELQRQIKEAEKSKKKPKAA